jgi:hypothetical protein
MPSIREVKARLRSPARALNAMERYYGKERNEQENQPRRVRAAVHGLPFLPARSPMTVLQYLFLY